MSNTNNKGAIIKVLARLTTTGIFIKKQIMKYLLSSVHKINIKFQNLEINWLKKFDYDLIQEKVI